MEGRIVFPELRNGKPVWLIGRQLEINDDAPRYLGLAGGKPLLGWEWASLDLRGACLVEGPTDWLALRMWGVPGHGALRHGCQPAHNRNAQAMAAVVRRASTPITPVEKRLSACATRSARA